MQHLDHLASAEDVSGTWCNSNAVTSSVMEAVSFVTPDNEAHFRLIEKRNRMHLPREIVAGFEPQPAPDK